MNLKNLTSQIKEKLEQSILESGIEGGIFEIEHNGEILGHIEYEALIEGGRFLYQTSYDSPPEYSNVVVNFRNIVVASLFSTNDRELPNVIALLNRNLAA